MPLLESMLLSFIANHSRNWTFQRFARVAEKERTQRNKIKILHSLGFEPRFSAYRSEALPSVLRCQLAEPEFNPYKHTHLQITPPLSFFRVDFLNDIFLFVDSSFFYGCPHMIQFI